MSIAIINNVAFDGSMCFAQFGALAIPITAASYGDALETDAAGDCGSQEEPYVTPGRIKNKQPTFTFRMNIFLAAFQPALATMGFGNTALPVTCSYVTPDSGSESDLIEACRYVDFEQKWDNTNKVIVCETKWVCARVRYSNARKLRGSQIAGAGDSGDSQFVSPLSLFIGV